ncbi:protein MEI2-like 3 isoform X2 [Miscanthus floridulus]|uniref:protein MEI2-like 3 isoform X2 n=1 Tax=Miscanthus floridulus TaxID=154761 RepID=UPI0034593132
MVIASGAVDRSHLSPFAPLSESPSSSFFSQDLVPTERQVGFWKSSESMVDHKGSKPAFTSPLDKVHPMGSSPAGGLEHQRGQAFKGQMGMLNLGNLVGQQENAPGIPSISWGDVLSSSRSSLGLSTGGTAFVEPNTADQHAHDYGDCPSSSSFKVFSSKSRLMASGVYGQSADANDTGCEGDEPLGSMKEMEAQTIGDLLPNDDDLISGIIDGFEYTGLSNQDDADEDIFYTGGGLELEHDDSNNVDKFREVSFKSQLSGDVKEIYKAPTSCNKKFVEFYDTRAAQEALNDLNNSDMSCSQIKVDHSRSGGAGSCFTEQCSGEQKQNAVAHQLKNSPLGTIGKLDPKSWESSTVCNLYSPVRPQHDKSQHGFSVNAPQKLSLPIRIESTRQHSNQIALGEPSGSLGHGNFGGGLQAFHPHSLPEYHNGICNGANSMTLNARNSNFRLNEGMDYNNHKVDHNDLHGHSSDQNEAFRVTGIGSCPLHGHHYTWSNSNAFPQSPSAPMLWSNFQQPVHMHCYPAMPPHVRRTAAHPMDQHHLGSAPNSVGGFANAHSFHPGSLESVGFPGSPQLYPSDLSVFASARGNYRETMFSPVSAGFPSIQQIFHVTNGRNPMVHVSTSYDATNDRIRSRRHDGNAAQSENKQFELDLDRIAKGEDSRTTLMIKNIPNKYNCKLLLAVIDENHRGTYDFIYLPIDFKNKCNVGYAFINMTDPQHIIPFYKTFNGKKWEKFNSEKVASLAYARIQGRNALIAHFQNSSLMNEEKWCRPMLFHKDGPHAGDQEPFPVGNNVRSRSGRNRPLTGSETTKEGSPSTSPN